jgi:hypothetical protein
VGAALPDDCNRFTSSRPEHGAGSVIVPGAQRCIAVVSVESTATRDAALDLLGQHLVGGVGIGEQRVAALARDL